MSAAQPHFPRRFLAHPCAYDLWQAYVLLDAYAPELWEDGWRFCFPASLSFSSSEVAGLRFVRYPDRAPLVRAGMDQGAAGDAERACACLDVALSGIMGPEGPMPSSFREDVVQEGQEGNTALQEFLDIFQNHLLRLWMAEASGMCAELGAAQEGEDVPSACVRAAGGTGEGAPFRLGWAALPERFRTRLGRVNSRLGTDAMAGSSVFDSCPHH